MFHHSEWKGQAMFQHIVVAVDGSDQANNALDIACEIAKKFSSNLHLAHTPEVDTTAIAIGAGVYVKEPTQEEIEAAGREVIKAAEARAAENGCRPVSIEIGNANPAHHVLDVAERVGADLIVTGRRGLGGLSRLLLGSTSQRIANDADCACMTVK